MRLLLAWVFVVAGCGGAARAGEQGGQPPAPVDDEDPSAPLVARIDPPRLTVPAGGVAEVTLVVENRGSTPQRLDARVLAIPQLSIRVTRDGARIAPMSPPVPVTPSDEDFVTLRPGESHRVRVRLDVFSPPLATGDYAVRSATLPGRSAIVTIK